MRFSCSLLLAFAIFLGGCATKPQVPVDLDLQALAPPQRVGVALAKLPAPALHLPGADCLLCILFATAANSNLGKHADQLGTEEFASLREELAEALRKKGSSVVVITESVDIATLKDLSPSEAAPKAARKDFAGLRQKLAVDKLVVVQVDKVGFERTYSAYIPTSDPKAVLRGSAYMVDLATNTYEWYLALSVARSADGAWDEPSKFPGLTNAYFQSLEQGRQQVIKPFRQ